MGEKKTALIPSPRRLGPADVRLTERYEALRVAPDTVAHSGLGRALLMHHGMATWMHAWVSAAPAAEHRGASALRPKHTSVEPSALPTTLPANVEGELVHVLAQMTIERYTRAST